jgi:ABC-type antimicrobial peptide transport system permease subunit
LRGTLRLALAGIAIGLAGAWLLGRLVAALLFDTSPTDTGTFGLTAALLITVAAMAAYVPALRASRIQPMRALQGN